MADDQQNSTLPGAIELNGEDVAIIAAALQPQKSAAELRAMAREIKEATAALALSIIEMEPGGANPDDAKRLISAAIRELRDARHLYLAQASDPKTQARRRTSPHVRAFLGVVAALLRNGGEDPRRASAALCKQLAHLANGALHLTGRDAMTQSRVREIQRRL